MVGIAGAVGAADHEVADVGERVTLRAAHQGGFQG